MSNVNRTIEDEILDEFRGQFGTGFICYIPQPLIMSMYFVDQSGLSILEQLQDG